MKVIVILLVATIVLADFDTSCTPFGVRLTFGEYYSQQGGNTQLYVSFNTYVLLLSNLGLLSKQYGIIRQFRQLFLI